MAIRKRKSPARAISQTLAAIVANSGFPGLKMCPYPGLNCYACPLASFACPVGSLQKFIAMRQFPYAMAGFFASVGAVVGRAACGWACPFGFFQDLLARLGPKRKLLRSQRGNWIRYVVLIALVGVGAYAFGQPLFCKICPAGTLEGGIPQVLTKPELRVLIGPRYWMKIAVLAALVGASILIKRPFCRFVCPLGAIWSPFNRVSLMRLEVDDAACTKCGACKGVCPVDLEVYRDPNSDACIRCLECTRCDAVRVSWGGSEAARDTGKPKRSVRVRV